MRVVCPDARQRESAMKRLLFLALLSAWLARPVEAQRLRHLLTATAAASLWIDYCDDVFAIDHTGGVAVLGHGLTRTSLAAINLTELGLNVFTGINILDTPRLCAQALLKRFHD